MCRIKKILSIVLVATMLYPCNYVRAEEVNKVEKTKEINDQTEIQSENETKNDKNKEENKGNKIIQSNVVSLTGYVPVKTVGVQATQKTADELLKSLSKGELGKDLEFEEEMYPYFYMLNDTEKALYKQLYANAQALNKCFLPADIATEDELKNAFTAVVNDHPELFWLETAYKYRFSPSGQIVEMNLVFNLTANNIEQSKADFDKAVTRLVNDATYGLYTNYKREKRVHNDLLSNVKFDAKAPINQSAYSAVVFGRSADAGYARAFQYVLQQLDIPCYFVMGESGSNHAWNIVKLDDGFYNVDCAWHHTVPATYDYFNCSDKELAANHERAGLSVYLPECKASKYSDLEKVPPVIEEKKPETAVKPDTSAPTETIIQGTVVNNTTNTITNNTGNTVINNSAGTVTNNIANSVYSITVQTVRGQGDKGYIDNIEDYYIECFEKLMATDKKNVNFNLIVCSEELWFEIYAEYADGRCQDGYIERFLVEKHKNSCTVNVQAQKRSDGSYLIRHNAIVD